MRLKRSYVRRKPVLHCQFVTVSYIQIIFIQVVVKVLNSKFGAGGFAESRLACEAFISTSSHNSTALESIVVPPELVGVRLTICEQRSRQIEEGELTVVVKLVVNPFSADSQ